MDKIDLKTLDPRLVVEAITEAAHGGFDGWTEQERIVIEAFIDDIALYAREAAK